MIDKKELLKLIDESNLNEKQKKQYSRYVVRKETTSGFMEFLSNFLKGRSNE